MVYKYFYKIGYYDEDSRSECNPMGMVLAETSFDAMKQIADYYGDDKLTKVELYPSDEGPLELPKEAFDRYIAGDVCWDE